MSNLLLDWLTNEVHLSQSIYQFGDSFRDGYLLGEILYRYNQQLDFDQFSNKGTPLAILNNFRRLEPSMRKVGIKYHSRLVTDIMEGKEEVIKTLLYEMKAALEGIVRNSRISLNPNLANTRNDKVFNVITYSRPTYDTTVSRTFQQAVRGVLENTNEILMANATKKYTDRTGDYVHTIKTGEASDWDELTLRRQRSKDIYVSKKTHEKQIRDEIDTSNVKQWKNNQRTAHDRNDLKRRVNEELQTRHDRKVETGLNKAKHYTYDSIEDFEKRLEDMIIPIDHTEGEVIKSFKIA